MVDEFGDIVLENVVLYFDLHDGIIQEESVVVVFGETIEFILVFERSVIELFISSEQEFEKSQNV